VIAIFAKIIGINCTFKEFLTHIMTINSTPLKYLKISLLAICLLGSHVISLKAQDSTSKIPDLNQSKLVKKINAVLDSVQQKINNSITNKATEINNTIKEGLNNTINEYIPEEELRPLPYERLLTKKYNLGRRAYQNTAAQYNYLFNAEEELNELINKARNKYQEDYSSLLNFYDYDLSDIAKNSIDSIVYRCNANIVLHDLRSNWVDDSYLLLAKAYLYHKNFDTAGSILQFINYSFDEKDYGVDQPIGSNIRQVDGKFSIASKEKNRIWEKADIRNESMIWQAKNYLSSNQINEGLSLLQLLKGDALFPKRLSPFLHEQLAYGYYLMESYDNAAINLVDALPNAPDQLAKSRWYYLIAQLWQKANQTENAYKWYKKAIDYSPNPIIGVYAKINMVSIESKKSNQSWEYLASDLERILKKEKFKPYADIVYFEMAKLAINNNAYLKANNWLIKSIVTNNANAQQKQQSFELLGEINYRNDNYAIAKIAYDSLNNILKTNPEYEKITLRKKWMGTILDQTSAYQKEDSLLFFYKQPVELQKKKALTYIKQKNEDQKLIANLFSQNSTVNKASTIKEIVKENNFAAANETDFYFTRNYTVMQGKHQFAQKWGERPNVDMWRRKTSTNMANALSKSSSLNTLTVKRESADKIAIKKLNQNIDTLGLIQNESDLLQAQKKWNEAALLAAQTFLLQLNDFNKAKPIYKKIIANAIDANITERALLDLASQYLHEGQKSVSDSLIGIVISKFPNGEYQKKKSEKEAKLSNQNDQLAKYKEFYFQSQIGNWSKMNELAISFGDQMKGSKWYTPYQFLKVKMYAQQKQDLPALKLLDSIITNNKSDIIKQKASEISAEITNRKETEAYLKSFEINKEIQTDTQSLSSGEITFINDSSESHYIVVAINNIALATAKKAQTALMQLNKDNSANTTINVTFSELEKNNYLLWLGPFDNKYGSIQYLNKVKPKLNAQILALTPKQQFEIYIFGKSNISMINTPSLLTLYKDFMINKIYKP
jgi:hypothetical protein